MVEPRYLPLPQNPNSNPEGMLQRSEDFLALMQTRRTVRQFSNQPVPKHIIENCIRTAASAPSGANLQPWYFVAVTSSSIKRQIRIAAEAEEHEFYTRRATPEWLAALEPLGTDEHKPFLETAPYLIAIFVQTYGNLPNGKRLKHYYAQESVGIATGMLISALHFTGLATLTHTPSPMNFLNHILNRPANEKPFLLLVTGYPAPETVVPEITKKSIEEVVSFL